MQKPEEAKKVLELIEQIKPEAMYFSTMRRFSWIIMNVEDPHVELRKLLETLSKHGKVTIDPVSTFEEFGAFLKEQSAHPHVEANTRDTVIGQDFFRCAVIL